MAQTSPDFRADGHIRTLLIKQLIRYADHGPTHLCPRDIFLKPQVCAVRPACSFFSPLLAWTRTQRNEQLIPPHEPVQVER